MIDITQAPYNLVADWTGSDSTATDWANAIEDAIGVAATVTSPGYDLGGAGGDTIHFPKGAIKVGRKLVLPTGVEFVGANAYGTVLKLADNFDGSSHFLDLGDATTQIAAFGCRIRNMILFSNAVGASAGAAMIYTNNTQDTADMLCDLRIYAGQRSAFRGEIGYGGASRILLRNVTANNHGTINPVYHFNYGDATSVVIDGMQSSGTPDLEGTIGLQLDGGRFDIRRFHAEYQHIGANVNLAGGMAEFHHSVGHPTNKFMMLIEKLPAQLNRITVRNLKKNGSYQSIYNLQPAGKSYFCDIDAEVRF